MIREDHHLGDRCVEVELRDVRSHLLDGRVEKTFGLRVVSVRFDLGGDISLPIEVFPPDPAEKSGDSFDALGAPWFRILERSHEHEVEARGIGSESFDHLIGIDDIADAFRHLGSVFSEDHPLVKKALIGFGLGDSSDIVQEKLPKSGVEQMQNGVFGPPDIVIRSASPVPFPLRVDQSLSVFRITESEVIPA